MSRCFNAQEIVDYLNRKLISYILNMCPIADNDKHWKDFVEILPSKIQEYSEHVRAVERYEVAVEKYGLKCETCVIQEGSEECKRCKTRIYPKPYRYRNFKPLYTLDDFRD